MSLIPASELHDVPWPACSKQCSLMDYCGAGECESACPHKFESNHVSSPPNIRNDTCPKCGGLDWYQFGNVRCCMSGCAEAFVVAANDDV